MLRRPHGTNGSPIAESMGWAPPTGCGFLAGLGPRGHGGRGHGARPPGRAQQAGREGELHDLPPRQRVAVMRDTLSYRCVSTEWARNYGPVPLAMTLSAGCPVWRQRTFANQQGEMPTRAVTFGRAARQAVIQDASNLPATAADQNADPDPKRLRFDPKQSSLSRAIPTWSARTGQLVGVIIPLPWK
jgi:hypothetical protein